MEPQDQNYTQPALFSQKIPLTPINSHQNNFYSSHHLPQDYEVPCFSLMTDQPHPTQALSSKIYTQPEHLTLLTYNVWFQEPNMDNRYRSIIQMIADSGADIVCLQEVNQQFLKLLLNAPQKHQNMRQYFYPKCDMHWYDTLILTRYPCRFYKKVFGSSKMGRCSLTAVLQLSNTQKEEKITVGVNCVHLQSLYYSAQRVSQLEFIQELNQNVDLSIVAGDFNFGDNQWGDNKKEMDAISIYEDMWKKGKRHFSKWATEAQRERGFTMPTNRKFPCCRPDKVLYRFKDKRQVQGEIEIVGDFTITPFEHEHFDKIGDDDKVRTPSDHFGLIATLPL